MNNSNEKRARRIASLLAGYIRDTLSPAEHDELDEWVGASDKNMRLFEELTDEKRIQLALELLNDNSETGILSELHDEQANVPATRSIFRTIKRYAVAASVIVAVGISAVLFFSTRKNESNGISKELIASILPQDFGPAINKAFLTLEDRSVMELNQETTGTIATQGVSNITNQDGQVRYTANNPESQVKELMNSITTPKGGLYSIILPDGSTAWINNGSSVTYPAVFTGNERKVSVTGEVYFEIASAKTAGPNYGKPFIVNVPDKDMSVQVLGTHFNINAYKDEAIVKTTLLEGSVKIATGSGEKMMVPGQQAQVTAKGDIKLASVNIETVMAWKDGLLHPEGEELGSVMKKVGRWFDTEIVFEDNTNTISRQTLNAIIPLKDSLSHVLHSISLSVSNARFSVEGKKIIVRPS